MQQWLMALAIQKSTASLDMGLAGWGNSHKEDLLCSRVFCSVIEGGVCSLLFKAIKSAR